MAAVPLRRLLVLALLVLGIGAGVPAPAQASKAVRAAVEITAVQTAAESGNGFELTVLGTARGSNHAYVTVGDDPYVIDALVYKGDWGVGVNPRPAGTLTICAEVRRRRGGPRHATASTTCTPSTPATSR